MKVYCNKIITWHMKQSLEVFLVATTGDGEWLLLSSSRSRPRMLLKNPTMHTRYPPPSPITKN